jgi:hypothetical protein
MIPHVQWSVGSAGKEQNAVILSDRDSLKEFVR